MRLRSARPGGSSRSRGDDQLIAYALEKRSAWWVFALACLASSLYGWLAGTWPFAVVEGIWALVALRRWWSQKHYAGH